MSSPSRMRQSVSYHLDILGEADQGKLSVVTLIVSVLLVFPHPVRVVILSKMSLVLDVDASHSSVGDNHPVILHSKIVDVPDRAVHPVQG